MNISLPDALKEFVDHRVSSGGYSSHSEYVRDLIRKDQLETAKDKLRALIREGLESGPGMPMDDAWLKAKRKRIRERVKQA